MTGCCVGSLLVLSRDHTRRTKQAYWKCKCACGQVLTVRGTYLRKGRLPYCHSCPPGARFWGRVNQKERRSCWLWLGSPGDDGYGQFKNEGRTVRAHRFAYMDQVGEIPEGLLVCHSCDTPLCCNPAHLFLGTAQDNEDDKVKKKRQAKGIEHGRSKMTPTTVKNLRRRRAAGASYRTLAKEFGIDHTTVAQIVRGETWAHVI